MPDPDKKRGLSAYERRYIAVLAAAVLVFVSIGIAMSYFPSFPSPDPMPISYEEVRLVEPQPDTARIHRHQERIHKKQKDKSEKKVSSKRKRKRTTSDDASTPSAPSRGPVHTAPIPDE